MCFPFDAEIDCPINGCFRSVRSEMFIAEELKEDGSEATKCVLNISLLRSFGCNWHVFYKHFVPTAREQRVRFFVEASRGLTLTFPVGYRNKFAFPASDRHNASRSSSGLGHRPFTAATRVRLPYGTPNSSAFFAISADIMQMKYFLMDLSVNGWGHSANLSPVKSYVS
jgi:hypothetical protein